MADTRYHRSEPTGGSLLSGVEDIHTTSLKWGSDGELSELDLQRILGLLSQADPVAEALIAHHESGSTLS